MAERLPDSTHEEALSVDEVGHEHAKAGGGAPAQSLAFAREKLGPGLLQHKIARRARARAEARDAASKDPSGHEAPATGRPTDKTGDRALASGDVHATPRSMESSTILLSNNPEGIRTPGTLVDWSSVPEGNVGIYIHHSNLTRTPLDFYVAVRPNGPDVRWSKQGYAAHGGVPDAQQFARDPNYQVAHAAAAGLDETRLGASHLTPLGETQFHVVRLEGRTAGDPPLMDSRYEFHLAGGGAQVAVVSVAAPGQFHARDGLPARAAGNSKIAHPETVGRAAGVYTGAEWNDAQNIDVKDLSEVRYWLTSTNKNTPQAPQHTAVEGGAKRALPLDPGHLASWIRANSSDDVVIAKIVREVWQVDSRWLEEKHWYDGAHFTARAEKEPSEGGMTVDYKAMTLGLRPSVAEARAALAQAGGKAGAKGAPSATHSSLGEGDGDHDKVGAVAAYLQKYPMMGAPTDTANYGTEYHLHFHLQNNDAQRHKVHFALVNVMDSPYRGSVRVDTSVPAKAGLIPLIGHGGAMPITDVAVPSVELGGTAEVDLHFISPGQITGGQYLLIKKDS